MKEGIVNIKFMEILAHNSNKGNENSDSSDFIYRRESMLIVFVLNLFKISDYQSSFVPLNWAINFILGFEDPFRTDSLFSKGQSRKYLGFILLQCI